MAALTSAGLADLVEAAARPEARPSAAQLLPVTAAAEGLPRLERLLVGAARQGPRELAPAAEALVRSGGKRVRPLLTLLAARAAYGNGVSVLAGDWLLAASLDLALRSRTPGAVEALVRTLRTLVAGEARQLALRGSTEFTQEDALTIAAKKTGSLFAWCGEAGALAAGAARAVVEALREFGQRAGSAFQIADDLLDFEADASTLGKAVLADVAEGKPSLPLAIALKRLPVLREEMGKLLVAQGAEAEDLRQARVRAFAVKLNRTGALGAARRIAERERDAALEALGAVPPSPTRDLLAQVAQALLSRSR